MPVDETENADELMSCSPPRDWLFDDAGFNCDYQELQSSPVDAAQVDPLVQVSEESTSVQPPGPLSPPTASNKAEKTTTKNNSLPKTSKLPRSGPQNESNQELSPTIRIKKRRKKTTAETTSTPAQPRAEKKVVTPMPDFEGMNTPGLKVCK